MQDAKSERKVAALFVGACLGYLLFCAVIFTPYGQITMLWPYMFMLVTTPVHGLSAGDPIAFLVGDAFGLVVLAVVYLPLSRLFVNRTSLITTVAIGFLTWPIPLTLLQVVTFFAARLLGWPTGI
jgi:hypothetical protein